MSDRRAALADAAITVVAAGGMRALTHRAVDAAAGLPQGTTSAYFRTRKALVQALVQRLADVETAEIAASTPPPSAAPVDLDVLATSIAVLLDSWLSAPRRDRTLARYHCLLEATHHEELRTILAEGRRPRLQAEELLLRAGSPAPARHARDLVACIDGLLFDRLAGAGAPLAPAPGTPEHVADLTQTLRTLLAGLLRPPG
ncbi:DNA-binding transcriptional regulator YbjK [Crossiella equi]|uniref:DNA-binding transcriptional regulator YbjK n=1 Tax=Crossiella equi TaxID=130796 RepID=A0ABS5AFJ6_9PSEU|nr:TetR family transcriptional regulator [Crossiella equi]MBP2475355.1 DNA-binding transcriptional regulator YbjK [Crossiella equi]